jgi:hypothetical protein
MSWLLINEFRLSLWVRPMGMAKRIEDRYHSVIVMGWATAYGMRRAKLKSREILAHNARNKEQAFKAINLKRDRQWPYLLDKIKTTNHGGSGMRLPSSKLTRQVCTSAQTENKLAMGPKVPAINGNAVDVNHHKLRTVRNALQQCLGRTLADTSSSPPCLGCTGAVIFYFPAFRFLAVRAGPRPACAKFPEQRRPLWRLHFRLRGRSW